ncbi:hypothetical protein [Pseudoxanthomonas winnipegensis]|uniref:Uncharacterized protein n=1 Tax=Pseudoxanthomonas winnipegensis TaxID=2480810 RepID=A0A4Q8L4P3_9GAMM|nr:hypothetical protein [Pseudoxanthomonas winnipegensis]TAA20344.1 hypothetical protein EA660_18320 [Pseudoxanthomonas winnipegensis]
MSDKLSDKMPELPEPVAWHAEWDDTSETMGWDQYHDASDPLPEKWDECDPDRVVSLFTADQLHAYARQYAQQWRDGYVLHKHLLTMLGAKDHVDAGRIIAELHAQQLSLITCACPSGNGSLSWPCPVHPPAPAGDEGWDEPVEGQIDAARAAREGEK